VTPETRLFEVDRSENPLRTDLLADPFDPTGGRLTVPDAPGLGVDVDSDALDRYCLE
jgi:D-galactarolactone cycloisomerase